MHYIDQSQFPILRIRFDPENTYEELNAYLSDMEAIFAEHGKFLTITDISNLQPLKVSSRLRHRMAEGVDQLAYKKAFIAEAVVISSPIIRGLFTAYSWLRRVSTHPLRSFRNMEEAEQWAQAILRGKAGNQSKTPAS